MALSEGQFVVIGAVALGLISGLCAGGLFGALIDESMVHIKDLTLFKSEEEYGNFVTAAGLSTLGFGIVIMAAQIGMVLGYGAYSFLISIKGQRAKATALAGAAPVALLGITACGAAIGAVYHKCLLAHGLYRTLVFSCVFFGVLSLCSIVLPLMHVDCVLYLHLLCITIYGIAYITASFGFYLGLTLENIYSFFTGVCLGLLVNSIYFYVCSTHVVPHDYVQNLLYIPTVCPTYLLFSTMFVFVSPVKVVQSAGEKGLVFEVLATQLFKAALGHLVYLQAGGRGGVGAGKVCASAVAAGGAVIVAIQKASPMLNTGARLWGLLGVSGAAGVALSAAGELGQRYGQAATQMWGGTLGRTAAIVGAAAGAFFSAGTEDFSFGLFKAVCAAIISGMPLAEHRLQLINQWLDSL